MNSEQFQKRVFLKQNLEICVLGIILIVFLAMLSRSTFINGKNKSPESYEKNHSLVSIVDDKDNHSPEIGH